MRVLFFSTSVEAGAARVLADIVRHLDRSEFDFCVVVRGAVEGGPLAELPALGVTLHECRQPTDWLQSSGRKQIVVGGAARLPGQPRPKKRPILAGLRSAWHGLRRDWPVYRQLRRLIARFKPDVVWLNGFGGNVGLAYLLRSQNIPLLVHCHMTTPLTWFHRLAAAGVTRFVSISETVAQTLRSAQRPISILPNAVDLTRSTVQPDETQLLRRELGIDPDRRIVSVVGRLVPWKGQDDFLRALSRVRNVCPDVLGLIVGGTDGTRESEQFAERLRIIEADLGLKEHVRLLGFRDDIARIYAASEVVVLCSKMPEPFGLVITEAMAASRPVVATAAGGPSEIIENGTTGLLVPMDAPDAQAEAILKLLNDAELANYIAQSARRAVETRFSIQAYVANVAQIISESKDRIRPSGRDTRSSLDHAGPPRMANNRDPQ